MRGVGDHVRVRVKRSTSMWLLVVIATWSAATAAGAVVLPAAIGKASSSVTMTTVTTAGPNPALAHMVAGARYTGKGKLAAVVRSNSAGPCSFPKQYGGQEYGQGCRANTVHATISFVVAPDKSKITNLVTGPLTLPLTATCGVYGHVAGQGTIPLTSKATGTTKTRYAVTHTSLTFVGDTFTFHWGYSFAKGSKRVVDRTLITGSFPPTGPAHVDIRLADRGTHQHTTYTCATNGAFSVRSSA